MSLSLQKTQISPRRTGRLEKQIWVEKTLVRALVTCGKTPTIVTWTSWSEHLRFISVFLLRSKDQARVQQSASKFPNLPLPAGNGANWALALSVSGASRSPLCRDALMDLAFIYSALPICLVVYVQKSDFHLTNNVFCTVIVVKKCRILCLAQRDFSYFVLHSSKIPGAYDQSYTFAQPTV